MGMGMGIRKAIVLYRCLACEDGDEGDLVCGGTGV